MLKRFLYIVGTLNKIKNYMPVDDEPFGELSNDIVR